MFRHGHDRYQHIALDPPLRPTGNNVRFPDSERAPGGTASCPCVEGFGALCAVSGMLAEGRTVVGSVEGRAELGERMLDALSVAVLIRRLPQNPSAALQYLNSFLSRWKSAGTATLHPVMQDFLTAWVSYIVQTTWSYQETSSEQGEREWKSFDATYAEANRIFTGPGPADSVGFLGKAMKKMAENLMHLAFRVSRSLLW